MPDGIVFRDLPANKEKKLFISPMIGSFVKSYVENKCIMEKGSSLRDASEYVRSVTLNTRQFICKPKKWPNQKYKSIWFFENQNSEKIYDLLHNYQLVQFF